MRGHWCRKGSKWEATEIGTSRSTFSARATRSRTATHRVGSSRTARGVKSLAERDANDAIARLAEHVRTPLYGGAYALILSSVATSALGIVYWTLAARLYDPAQVGVNAAAISTMTFLSYLTQLNLAGALSRFIPTAGRSTSRLVGAAYLLVVVLSGFAAFVFLAGLGLWAPQEHGLASDPLVALW